MLRTLPTTGPRAVSAARTIPAIRAALVVALTALVLVITALAYVVSFEAIRAFAITTAAFPPALAWAAPLLVDSFTTAATLVILWRYLRGEPFFAAWYAWVLVAAATADRPHPTRTRMPPPGRNARLPKPSIAYGSSCVVRSGLMGSAPASGES
jgi:hypothetical protein